ncbi:MAG: hypothetical protein RJA36_2870 [Pseudomonadota bacterium]
MPTFSKSKRSMIALLCSCAAFGALAQSRPLTAIVPWPAGGPSDFVIRQLQPDMSKYLGQAIVVENLGGVSGAIGVQKALSATADGNTVLVGSPMELIIAPLAFSSVKYNPSDIRMAAQIVKAPLVLLARKDLPASNVDELIALADKGGELSIANAGTGSFYHLAAEKFAQQSGVKLLHVPYKGSAPVLADLMGGQIDLSFTIMTGNVPNLISEGKVKALGLATTTPLAKFPQLAALGAHPKLAGFEFNSWAGIMVPRHTPEEAVNRLNKAAYEALQNPEVRKAFEATGTQVVPSTSLAELDRVYRLEITRYQSIAKSINLQKQ